MACKNVNYSQNSFHVEEYPHKPLGIDFKLFLRIIVWIRIVGSSLIVPFRKSHKTKKNMNKHFSYVSRALEHKFSVYKINYIRFWQIKITSPTLQI